MNETHPAYDEAVHSQSSLITDNPGYGDSTFLQFRLDTDPLLADIEQYLRGIRTKYVENEEGDATRVSQRLGERKCNELGVQSIMAFVQNVVNPMGVQGFYERDEMYTYLTRTRKSFAKYLMVNRYKFGIALDEYQGIMTTLFSLIDNFMTRTVNNWERKLLSPGRTEIERTGVEKFMPKKQGFKLF